MLFMGQYTYIIHQVNASLSITPILNKAPIVAQVFRS